MEKMEIIYTTVGIGMLVLVLGLYTGVLFGVTFGRIDISAKNYKNEV
ncbi:hypothetical protein [Clostridium aminobutyricum]|uniref:Uncharacterized protein n=1 Tax=Clostridium aminobutyricum TaxID=33953 RepID=A0A939IGP7_CLOAM|nr:hypothetical protein [Clostridium aminobutyricum]MBN7772257.1 hypothetical protein [Clostridium aminobutyricum]